MKESISEFTIPITILVIAIIALTYGGSCIQKVETIHANKALLQCETRLEYCENTVGRKLKYDR